MTHAELYEIVKDHRDVWGQHFHTVRRSNETTELVRHFSNEQPEPEHLGAELLGLGVAWLAEKKNGIVSLDLMVILAVTNGSGLLRETYAAIAEVNRAQA